MTIENDPYASLAMMTNEEIALAVEVGLSCCIEGKASEQCCDCWDLRNRVTAIKVADTLENK